MAAMELTSSLSEIISTLDSFPDKLHCPVCDKFLFNGYKSSCCDQAICESCYGEVSDHCPMCEHRPFSQDLCKPYKAIRNTAKAFLKTHEKKLVDERAKAAAATDVISITTVVEPTEKNAVTVSQDDDVDGNARSSEQPLDEASGDTSDLPLEDQPQPSIEVADDVEVDDDAVNLITEEAQPLVEKAVSSQTQSKGPEAPPEPPQDEQGKDDASIASQMQNVQNMMNMNPMFNGMDMNQMMQMMAANGLNMNAFNPMMAMQGMAMNPMSQGMFGAFGGPGAGTNGMNGMNMGMNYPTNQAMYGAGWNSQNNNMWNGPPNNNPSDFGSNAGYGYNQHGNFNQHQFNGDFQNGSYGRGFGRGRGRGRGRGGFDRFDRGRGGFNNFSQSQQPHFQNAHEQQQYEIQNMQASMMEKQPRQPNAAVSKVVSGPIQEDETSKQVDDEFAPGGQEEVQEALGGDYNNAAGEDIPAVAKLSLESELVNGATTDASAGVNDGPEAKLVPVEEVHQDQSKAANDTVMHEAESLPSTASKLQIAEIYQEDSHASMPPPSAPLGPAAHFSEPVKDFGFRGRGHGRFGSKGRGTALVANGVPLSPAKASTQSPVSPKEAKTVGVVGAPTGPKAMREAPSKVAAAGPAAARGTSAGFQIMGRASMVSQKGPSLVSERSRSGSPANLYNGRRSLSPSTSRRPSQPHRQTSSRHDGDGTADYDRDRDRDRDRERKHRKSKRDDEDHDMRDAQPHERGSSPGESRKSSHRSHREKDGHTSSSKHHSSRSRRHDEENGDGEVGADDYGIPTPSSREDREHRSSKSSRHESRRERHRDSERDERHRDRKRSRHDRDDDEPAEDEEARRRSRKHKTHHDSNGRGSHRSSEAPTPAAEAPVVDPHTLERQARDKERMLKEKQRREKASGRRVSYKYEDEVQAGVGERERESARWR